MLLCVNLSSPFSNLFHLTYLSISCSFNLHPTNEIQTILIHQRHYSNNQILDSQSNRVTKMNALNINKKWWPIPKLLLIDSKVWLLLITYLLLITMVKASMFFLFICNRETKFKQLFSMKTSTSSRMVYFCIIHIPYQMLLLGHCHWSYMYPQMSTITSGPSMIAL